MSMKPTTRVVHALRHVERQYGAAVRAGVEHLYMRQLMLAAEDEQTPADIARLGVALRRTSLRVAYCKRS